MLDLKKIANNDLMDYIASHQVFKINKDLSFQCMKELLSRAKTKEEFEEFQKSIDLKVKELNILLNENKNKQK